VAVTVNGSLTGATFVVTETSGYLPLPDTFTSTYTVSGSPAPTVDLTYTFLRNGVPYAFPTTDPVTTQPGTFVAPNMYTISNAAAFENTTFTFVESGTYTVTLTGVDSCGGTSAPVVRVIQILEPQALSVTTAATPGAGNAPLTVSFASSPTGGVPDASSQYLYDWDFGDGSAHSTAQNPTHVYAAGSGPGPWLYTASVTVTDFYPVPVPPGIRHTATANVTITVYAGMTVVASATTPTSGSKPLTVDFNAAVSGGDGNYSYLWYFGDGATSTLANPTHVYSTAGTYFAYVVVNDTASHNATSNQVVISVYDPLIVTANASPSAGIVPLAVAFSAAANGGDNNYTYTWDFGDGSPTATGALVNHTYTTAAPTGTVYTVNLHVVDGVGHFADKVLTVNAYQALTASIAASTTSGTTPLVVNFTSTVAGGDGAYTYLWNFGDGTTANTANPTKTYNSGGNFSVTLTVTDGASHVVISNTINMTAWSPMTVASSATPTNIIVGQSITFTAQALGGDGVYTYSWTFGDGTTGTGATVNHTYAVGPRPSFTYTAYVVVTDTAGHSVTGANIVITVKPVPPTILAAQKLVPPTVPSWRLKLIGTNFQNGMTVTISGVPVTVTFKDGGEVILKDCKSLCPKGVAVPIVATNPDGGISATFFYTRGPQP
jgi:PKD repeat protein